MRLDDAATLDVSAYDAAQAILTILPNKTARRKPNPLTIPVLPELAEALAKTPKQGPLLPSLAAEQATKNNTLSQRMARMIREAGEGDTAAGKASFHSLRATFVSMMDEDILDGARFRFRFNYILLLAALTLFCHPFFKSVMSMLVHGLKRNSLDQKMR
jgi:integrase